jgi:hypothetical protein
VLVSTKYVSLHGTTDRIAEALQRFANEEWTADHLTPEQAADALLDRFALIVENE